MERRLSGAKMSIVQRTNTACGYIANCAHSPEGDPIKQNSIAAIARASRNLLVCVAAGIVAAACGTWRTGPPAPVVTASGSASLPPSAPDAAPAAPASTLEGYKQEVARRIYSTSSQNLFEGAPPPLLKSVVVLSITIDSDGHPRRVVVQRSNGFSNLEQLAVQSVQRAAPLPRPGRQFARNGIVEFSETWLFQDDGRFQIRLLALVQSVAND